jgi:hypothetical protein
VGFPVAVGGGSDGGGADVDFADGGESVVAVAAVDAAALGCVELAVGNAADAEAVSLEADGWEERAVPGLASPGVRFAATIPTMRAITATPTAAAMSVIRRRGVGGPEG